MALFFRHELFLLLLLVSSFNHGVGAQDVDEASCICGINLQLLQKVESIVKAASAETASCLSLTSSSSSDKPQVSGDDSSSSVLDDPNSLNNQNSNPFEGRPTQETPGTGTDQSSEKGPDAEEKSTNNKDPVSSTLQPNKGTGQSDPAEQKDGMDSTESPATTSSDVVLMISKLTTELHRLESQYHNIVTIGNTSNNNPSTTYTHTTTSSSNMMNNNNNKNNKPQRIPDIEADFAQIPTPPASLQVTGEPKKNVESPGATQPINSGFLHGLSTSPVESGNQQMVKLNESQKVDPQKVTDTIQTTVPNVVSNIFSNIQNLTIQTMQNQSTLANTKQNNTLSSIDGESVNTEGDSSKQIEAQGEKLLLIWIEHQLDSLHLTASMANYIRKSAVSLFHKIIRQYIERVEKLGGNIEQNVQRATQMALSNTQNLISFLLKNYLNVSGGLMQIIGDQVSRVGKHLDSTGETIAHISLNPFDIVSNVIESLPNPSTYANYFRAFGKQLAGDSEQDESQEQQTGQEQEQSQTETTRRPHRSLLSKTVGALGKTFGSWLG